MVVNGDRGGLRLQEATILPVSGSILAADLNADRHADLIVGEMDAVPQRTDDYGSGRMSLFLGGPSRVPRWCRLRRLRRPRSDDDLFGAVLAVGDVNGDGRVDIVEGSQGSTENTDGEGIPDTSPTVPASSGPKRCRALGGAHGGGPTALEIADVDGDGYGDVIAGRPVNSFVADDDPPGAVRIWRGSREARDAAR